MSELEDSSVSENGEERAHQDASMDQADHQIDDPEEARYAAERAKPLIDADVEARTDARLEELKGHAQDFIDEAHNREGAARAGAEEAASEAAADYRRTQQQGSSAPEDTDSI